MCLQLLGCSRRRRHQVMIAAICDRFNVLYKTRTRRAEKPKTFSLNLNINADQHRNVNKYRWNSVHFSQTCHFISISVLNVRWLQCPRKKPSKCKVRLFIFTYWLFEVSFSLSRFLQPEPSVSLRFSCLIILTLKERSECWWAKLEHRVSKLRHSANLPRSPTAAEGFYIRLHLYSIN